MTKALILIDHGSRVPEANQALERSAEFMNGVQTEFKVRAAHMEIAEPFLEEQVKYFINEGFTEIYVFVYMVSAGRHATVDIPNQCKEILKKYPNLRIHLSGPIAMDSLIAGYITSRVQNSCEVTVQ